MTIIRRRRRDIDKLHESDERALDRFLRREQKRIDNARPIDGSCHRVRRGGDAPAEGIPDL